jgi:hypothetical protein
VLQHDDPADTSNSHLLLHKTCTFLVYATAIAISALILLLPNATRDAVTTLSTGAILATFGSALCALGQLWCNDFLNRVMLNVDILYKDIFESQPWRRWPFLPRGATRSLLSGDKQAMQLRNPEVPLNVGTHHITATFPTVLDDLFDLPTLRNFWQQFKFRHAARTYFTNVEAKETVVAPSLVSPHQETMAYECLLDTWGAVISYRLARYLLHFGAALTLSSALLTAVALRGNV